MINEEYQLDIKDATDRQTQRTKEQAFNIIEQYTQLLSSISTLSNQLFSNVLDDIDRQTQAQLDALDKIGNAALKKANDNAIERLRIEEYLAAERLRIEEEGERKRKEVQKKQAITDLTLTTIQIGVETALAVLKAETLPEKILNGALGATALATAIAAKTQVLKLGKGGTLFGPSHSEGGIRGTGAFGDLS